MSSAGIWLGAWDFHIGIRPQQKEACVAFLIGVSLMAVLREQVQGGIVYV